MHLIEVLARAYRKLGKDMGKRSAGGKCAPGPVGSAACGLQPVGEEGILGAGGFVFVAISRSRHSEVDGNGHIRLSARPALGTFEDDARKEKVRCARSFLSIPLITGNVL